MTSQKHDQTPLPLRFRWILAIRDRSDLSSTARLVAHTLSTHMAANGGDCFPSLGRLAREANMDRRTVTRTLRHLEAHGWIRRKRRRQRRGDHAHTVYTPLIPRGVGAEDPYPSEGGVGAEDPIGRGRDVPLGSQKDKHFSDSPKVDCPARDLFVTAIEDGDYQHLHRLVGGKLAGFDLDVADKVCRVPSYLLDRLEDDGREEAACAVGAPGDEAVVVADAIRDMIRKGHQTWSAQTFWAFVIAGAEVRCCV